MINVELKPIRMQKNHSNSFWYRGVYHFEEDGKFFYVKYGTKHLSISKKDFEKRQKTVDEPKSL